MAVIGARPVSSPWFLGGRRIRPRPRPRPRARHAPRRAGRSRSAGRLAPALDVRPLLVVIAVAAALAFFYLSQSTRVAATGYEIDSLEQQLAAARAEQQQLITAIGQARSPAEIVRRAMQELHLVTLDDSVVTFAKPADDQTD